MRLTLRPLHGIGVQIGACVIVLGGLTAMIGYQSWGGFSTVAAHMSAFETQRFAALRESSAVVSQVSSLPQGIAELVRATTPEELEARRSGLDAEIAELTARTKARSGAEVGGVLSDLDTLNAAIDELARSRATEMRLSEEMQTALSDVNGIIAKVTVGFNDYNPKDVIRLRSELVKILIAMDPEALAPRAKKLGEAGSRVAEAVPKKAVGSRNRLVELTDPDAGLTAIRGAQLRQIEHSAEVSDRTLETVAALINLVNDLDRTVVDAAAMDASSIAEATTNIKDRVTLILAVAALVGTLTLFFVHFTVVAPLRRLANRTRRLADQDLSALEGTRPRGGEIGGIQCALSVLRDNLEEKLRLEAEEDAHRQESSRAREAAKREEDRRLERKQQDAETAARMEAQHKAEIARKEQETRAATERERQARLDEQSQVMGQLGVALEKLAQGNLDATLPDAFPEAYESTRVNYNAAISHFSDIISGISSSSRNIQLSTTEITRAGEELTQRTVASGHTLRETSDSLNQLTKAVKTSAELAQRALEAADEARSQAEQGSARAHDTVTAIQEIEGSSEAISKIIGVIDGISFQTNLLALNAGVEAARAGETGRGFAVVASEVRALAQRSTDAAREISELVLASSESVKNGAEKVRATGQLLDSISVSVHQVSREISDIAGSARGQADSISGINAAVADLEGASQTNASMVEETSQANRSLEAEASRLALAVSEFKLPPNAAIPEMIHSRSQTERWSDAHSAFTRSSRDENFVRAVSG